ncbi:c-type cytochrome [Spirosoma agri]|uniref:C-type cytochrome n=1 Tax=Spirosoma agri TaxID=1987381 RepID=A0A6M0ICC3_9BACT|nr:cytochrome c [Spirosoma agri]NEU65487.1 c-type cytochrome [Spirosoma agri]
MSKLLVILSTIWVGLGGLIPQLPRPPLPHAVGDTLPNRFGFGKPATAAQISRIDIDVRPDGVGLPAGSGTAAKGQVIFVSKCAACHGVGGTGGAQGALVVTAPAPGKRPANVIGNYWPYASTVFDYIRRAMPFAEPGSLTNNEVYALTAYLLSANNLMDEKTVLDAKILPTIQMPAQKRFVPDDRRGGPDIH